MPLFGGGRPAAAVAGRAHLAGAPRPGYANADVAAFPEGSVTLLEVPALAISSSDLRERVAAGLPVHYLVPDGVVQYIRKRNLYRSSQ
jgi:nicotinate-nucleotide adenylyltransferase